MPDRSRTWVVRMIAIVAVNHLVAGWAAAEDGAVSDAVRWRMIHLPWYDAEHDSLRPIVPPLRRQAIEDALRNRSSSWQEVAPAPKKQVPASMSSPSRWRGVDWAQWIGWTTIGILLVSIIYFLVWAFVRSEPATTETNLESSRSASASATRIAALPLTIPARDVDLLSESDRLAQRGEMGTAMVYLFGYSLVLLDRHRMIRLAAGKTNRDYLRELARFPSAERMFGQCVAIFERSFFGRIPPDPAEWAACREALVAFESDAAAGCETARASMGDSL